MVIVVLENQGIQRMHQQEKTKGIVPCNYSRKDMRSVNEKCLTEKLCSMSVLHLQKQQQ